MEIEIKEEDIENAIKKLATKSMWRSSGIEEVLIEVVKTAAREHILHKIRTDEKFKTDIHNTIEHTLVTTMASIGKDIAKAISEGIDRGLEDKFSSL